MILILGLFMVKNNCMLGMGSGQPNRVESLRLAFKKAGEEAKGAALASDAFFPFGIFILLDHSSVCNSVMLL